jgi:hypothetical protein
MALQNLKTAARKRTLNLSVKTFPARTISAGSKKNILSAPLSASMIRSCTRIIRKEAAWLLWREIFYQTICHYTFSFVLKLNFSIAG